jgi:hypothetical protein
MEVYELSMPIVIEEIDAFNTNEDMFCTMDKTTNSLKDLVGRELYNYYQYPLILMEIANAF